MRITDLLDKRSISLDAVCASKSDALDQAVALMVKSGKINDEEAYRKQVYLREEESTTGIGEGIAIPHGKCDAVTKPGLADHLRLRMTCAPRSGPRGTTIRPGMPYSAAAMRSA